MRQLNRTQVAWTFFFAQESIAASMAASLEVELSPGSALGSRSE